MHRRRGKIVGAWVLRPAKTIPRIIGSENMAFSTTDWVALCFLGTSALMGTFGNRPVRIIGSAIMPFAFAGLILSLSHHGEVPTQAPITNKTPGINTINPNNTNEQSGDTSVLNIEGTQRLVFDATIGAQIASNCDYGCWISN
jgi:hypothetical protein